MKTYNQIITEAEGFQGKFTPSKDTKKQAIDVGKKVNPARQQPIPKGRALVKSSPNNSALKSVAKDLAAKGAKAAANKGIEMAKQKLLKPGNKNRFDNRQDEKQAGKGPDRAYGGGSYPKERTPDKKAMRNSSSVSNARMRQRYLERQKQEKAQAEKDKTKGGFMGGVKKSLGGDLIHKDDDKRREARFNRGKATADGIKSAAGSTLKSALNNRSGRSEGGSAVGNLSGPKRGQRGGGD